jgi:hypothetical protein
MSGLGAETRGEGLKRVRPKPIFPKITVQLFLLII